jgi:hypothetical protein
MIHQTIRGYRVISKTVTHTCKVYSEASAVAEKMDEAQIVPVFEGEEITYQTATKTPSPIPGVRMGELNPAQLVEVIRKKLRGTAAQIEAAQVIIRQDYMEAT